MHSKKFWTIFAALVVLSGAFHSQAGDNAYRLADHLSEINQEARNTVPYERLPKSTDLVETGRTAGQPTREQILQRIRMTRGGNAG